jgi:serine/threonine protein phosphatase PrpC
MNIQIKQPLIFSHIGQRPNNEDYVLTLQLTQHTSLSVLCDGMGGLDKGEVASKIVAEGVKTFFEKNIVTHVDDTYIIAAINSTYQHLDNYLTEHPYLDRMGTTIVLLFLSEQGATMAYLGDSRGYHIRNGEILYQTKDHKQVLDMVEDGIITTEQARSHPWRNRLSKAVTVKTNTDEGHKLQTDIPSITYITDVQVGDYFFLCSDGVLEQISDETLCSTLWTEAPNEQKLATLLFYCENKTRDNYSGILIEVANVTEMSIVAVTESKSSFFKWLGFAVLLSLGLFHASCQTIDHSQDTYAVVVGIADYKLLNEQTGDLRYADEDAQRFIDFLCSEKGGSVSAQNIIKITNQKATKNVILRAMQLFSKARPQDRIIFYFSGHGLVGSFVPCNGRLQDVSTLLSHQEIKALLKASKATTKLIIADACLSGSMKSKQKQTRENSMLTTQHINIAMLLATRSTQLAAETAQGGIFTSYLLKGLEGEADHNHDRKITIKELYNYVAPQIKKNTPNAQAPVFTGNFSDNLVLSQL